MTLSRIYKLLGFMIVCICYSIGLAFTAETPQDTLDRDGAYAIENVLQECLGYTIKLESDKDIDNFKSSLSCVKVRLKSVDIPNDVDLFCRLLVDDKFVLKPLVRIENFFGRSRVNKNCDVLFFVPQKFVKKGKFQIIIAPSLDSEGAISLFYVGKKFTINKKLVEIDINEGKIEKIKDQKIKVLRENKSSYQFCRVYISPVFVDDKLSKEIIGKIQKQYSYYHVTTDKDGVFTFPIYKSFAYSFFIMPTGDPFHKVNSDNYSSTSLEKSDLLTWVPDIGKKITLHFVHSDNPNLPVTQITGVDLSYQDNGEKHLVVNVKGGQVSIFPKFQLSGSPTSFMIKIISINGQAVFDDPFKVLNAEVKLADSKDNAKDQVHKIKISPAYKTSIRIIDSKTNKDVKAKVYIMDEDYNKVLGEIKPNTPLDMLTGKYYLLIYAGNKYKITKSTFGIHKTDKEQEIVLPIEQSPTVQIVMFNPDIKCSGKLNLVMRYDEYPFIIPKLGRIKYVNGKGVVKLPLDTSLPFTIVANDLGRFMNFPGYVFRHTNKNELKVIDLPMPAGITYTCYLNEKIIPKEYKAIMFWLVDTPDYKSKPIAFASICSNGKFSAKLIPGQTYYRYLKIKEDIKITQKQRETLLKEGKDPFGWKYYNLNKITIPEGFSKLDKEDIKLDHPVSRTQLESSAGVWMF